jgi:hypothetical protein
MQPLDVGISIAALIIVVFLLLISKGKGKQLRKSSNLTTFGVTLVVLGIIFGDNRWISYSFMGFGVLLSVVDGFRSLSKSN